MINIFLDPGCYELTKRSKKQTPIHLTVLSSIYEPTHTTTNSSGLLLAGKKKVYAICFLHSKQLTRLQNIMN